LMTFCRQKTPEPYMRASRGGATFFCAKPAPAPPPGSSRKLMFSGSARRQRRGPVRQPHPATRQQGPDLPRGDVHDEEPVPPVALADENQMAPVGGPARVLVVALGRELAEHAAALLQARHQD